MQIDTTKPSVGRIYDYVLGGHHNFEVDRQAAGQILAMFPSYPRWARLNRWFLQMVGQSWADAGYTRVLDLASGMPTQGHMHTLLPDAKVLYCDYDPMTVAYANQVISDTTQTRYIHADLREPAPLLDEADAFFGGERSVAIGCIGVSYFLSPAALSSLAQQLHTWTAPGSVMAATFINGSIVTDANQALVEMFKRMNSELFPRDTATFSQLMQPWHVQSVRPLASWLNVESVMQESDLEGGGAEMYGALLVRGE